MLSQSTSLLLALGPAGPGACLHQPTSLLLALGPAGPGACLHQPLIAITSPTRRHNHVRSPDTMFAIISKGNCVRACISDYRQYLSVIWYAYSVMQQPHRLLHRRHGCAQDHTLRPCKTDQFMGPVSKYSGLFSTAVDGTALGGASDRDHWSRHQVTEASRSWYSVQSFDITPAGTQSSVIITVIKVWVVVLECLTSQLERSLHQWLDVEMGRWAVLLGRLETTFLHLSQLYAYITATSAGTLCSIQTSQQHQLVLCAPYKHCSLFQITSPNQIKSNQINSWFSAPPTTRMMTYFTVQFSSISGVCN